MTATATSSRTRPQKRPTGSRAAGTSTTQSRRRSPAKNATPTRAAEQSAAAKERPTVGAAAHPQGESELVTWQEVPMPHVKVPVVHIAGPAARSILTNVRWTARTAASAVPQPKQVLYYGGVGVLAALGILEWPAAVAAAAGVWVATHSGGQAQPQDLLGRETRATARPATAAAR
ncbi:hypothetical protein OHA72_36295 [Dactylosporangium sp. NBC_01737]|uniref:hypothetical protein n=1 Tax=Dactylosporangium sp. NBC_01737 TaxID=2975959 RepID=UPI002E153B21|nr:hypothetical protein OHA72_36295 [Dactylosporangium sp. NBC_01737]